MRAPEGESYFGSLNCQLLECLSFCLLTAKGHFGILKPMGSCLHSILISEWDETRTSSKCYKCWTYSYRAV